MKRLLPLFLLLAIGLHAADGPNLLQRLNALEPFAGTGTSSLLKTDDGAFTDDPAAEIAALIRQAGHTLPPPLPQNTFEFFKHRQLIQRLRTDGMTPEIRQEFLNLFLYLKAIQPDT